MPARSRQRIPLHFGEGLERERGMLTSQPTDFADLRNVLLHEGKLLVRPALGAAGAGEFAEVDRLVAGCAIKSEGLGLVVGYSSTTRKVYVYRVAADLSLVELLGEWEHDLQADWGSSTPRIITAEVNGRIFFAHDERLVTRRAPTLYYDPITGDSLLNTLTATWADGESDVVGESIASADVIRFRGVVRHLSYLVGWGFGTADEDRPEMVRISKPGEPTDFELNSYWIAGDRRDPVLACGPAGSGPQGTILNVWKRTETHGIHGFDKRTFGIQLTDPRHGIVGSRAWLNLEGAAVAWGEEGPRLFTGLGPSESLELPLGLQDWEPDDLAEEGELADAFAQYVPNERAGLFIFGRRVYALTARVRGRWRWSWWELGFDPYGAMTFYGTTEEAVRPEAIPVFVEADPAGTYADITVRPDLLSRLLGDETLEIWLKERVSGSGALSEPSPGVYRGVTDFSEYAVAAGIPAGITQGLALDPFSGEDPVTLAIKNDPTEGNWFSIDGFVGISGNSAFKIDAWDEANVLFGEVLARVYMEARVSGRFTYGPALRVDTDSHEYLAATLFASSTSDLELAVVVTPSTSGDTSNYGFTDIPEAEQNGWMWMRLRLEDLGNGQVRRRIKHWWGDIEDEPAGWLQTTSGAAPTNVDGPGVGLGVGRFVNTNEQGCAFLSFSTDPDNFPPLLPDEIPSDETEWFRARSVAVSPSGEHTVRVGEGFGAALTPGTTYEVALRYRRGLEYSPGASDSTDPSTWPSVSQGDLTTTADPATLAAAEWSRTAADAEKITLTIEPVAGLEDLDILVYRRLAGSGDFELLDTIEGPHAASFTYDDTTIEGEKGYQYALATTANGALGDPTRVWAGPAAKPIMSFNAPSGAGYVVGFSTTDSTLATELHDAYDDAGGVQALSLRATADAGETEVSSGVLSNVPQPEFTFIANLRHKATAFGVDDYGEFGVSFNVTVPGSE